LLQNQPEGFYDSTCLTISSYALSEGLGQKSKKKYVYVYKCLYVCVYIYIYIYIYMTRLTLLCQRIPLFRTAHSITRGRLIKKSGGLHEACHTRGGYSARVTQVLVPSTVLFLHSLLSFRFVSPIFVCLSVVCFKRISTITNFAIARCADIVQYSTVQYSTVQYSTVQYTTVQYTCTHKQYIEQHN
jgi:hypothetical protein